MKICSSTLNFCQCGQVVHPRFEKMNGLRKVQKKGLKVGMFLTRNERLICGRLRDLNMARKNVMDKKMMHDTDIRY